MINIDFTTKPKETMPEYVDDGHGNKHLYDENGRQHSYNDLPAIIWATGAKVWFNHGVIHRGNDLPAMIGSTGTKYWYENGKCVSIKPP